MHSFVPIDISNEKRNNTDLIITVCGEEVCEPGHSFGPAIRDYYLIHFILDGEGFYEVDGVTHHLTKGHGFLICPYVVTTYYASSKNPWHYAWIGFYGLKAADFLFQAGITEENPIFTPSDYLYIKDCFAKMLETRSLSKAREITLLGLLHIFLANLIESNGDSSQTEKFSKNLYIREAINYISNNYSRNITIKDISVHLKLNRSYMFSLFKETLNISPQNFLINFRVKKACELIRDTSHSIGDISRSVGYEDPLYFSKVFKKFTGVSPIEYRKNL